MKTLEKSIAKHIKHPDKTCNICVKHMQHLNKHTCNVHLKKKMKHLERTLATYVYNIATRATSRSILATSICNTYNKPLKHLKQLKHTFATCAFNTTSPLLGRMEARQCVVFTEGSGPAAAGGYTSLKGSTGRTSSGVESRWRTRGGK
jgi:hypothetical protein